MTTERTKSIILNYIKKCEGQANKSQVVDYMKKSDEVQEEDRSSRITTLKFIKDLCEKRKIIIIKAKRKGQSDRLVFNDDDNFNILTSRIDRLISQINQIKKLANDVSSIVKKDLLTAKKSPDELRKYILNLTQAAQITIYGRITTIVDEIHNKIQSNTDRETLYLRLPAILSASNKLNEILMPQVIRTYEENREKLHSFERMTYSKIAAEISSLMTVD